MLEALYWLFVFSLVSAFILGFMSYGIIQTDHSPNQASENTPNASNSSSS